MIDLRGYGGKMVLVGQLGSSYTAGGFNLERCYVLGTLATGQDLSDTVKALLEDLDIEAPDADEVLWVLEVNAHGVPVQRFPLLVYDTQERLRYGAEFLAAVVQTGMSVKAVVLRGVELADPAC